MSIYKTHKILLPIPGEQERIHLHGELRIVHTGRCPITSNPAIWLALPANVNPDSRDTNATLLVRSPDEPVIVLPDQGWAMVGYVDQETCLFWNVIILMDPSE